LTKDEKNDIMRLRYNYRESDTISSVDLNNVMFCVEGTDEEIVNAIMKIMKKLWDINGGFFDLDE